MKESREGHMGGFRGGKGREKCTLNIMSQKKPSKAIMEKCLNASTRYYQMPTG